MDKWQMQEKIEDKWLTRGMIALLVVSFLSGFIFGDIAHYMVPINAIIVFGFCFMMYKSELANKLFYSYEKPSRAKRKKKIK